MRKWRQRELFVRVNGVGFGHQCFHLCCCCSDAGCVVSSCMSVCVCVFILYILLFILFIYSGLPWKRDLSLNGPSVIVTHFIFYQENSVFYTSSLLLFKQMATVTTLLITRHFQQQLSSHWRITSLPDILARINACHNVILDAMTSSLQRIWE